MMNKTMKYCTLTCLVALLWVQEALPEVLNIAVASNLTHTIAEISEQFDQDSGDKVSLTFGSSGNFARQIVQGAPYGVFISADRQYLDFISANSTRSSSSKALVHGHLSLYVPETSRLQQPATLTQALRMLQYSDYRRMAIANPEHAPYGKAAREALVNAGVWAINEKKLLLGENAAQAMQFCRSGSVDLCLVPASFLRLAQFTDKGNSFQLPAHWHKPISQYALLLDSDNVQARRYYDYLSSGSSAAVFRKYGYTLAAQQGS